MIIRVFRIISPILMLTVMGATAAAQDFQKSYSLPGEGSIRIGNISGNITVTGYGGDAVVVTAFKEGRDRDLVEIEDRSSGNRVDVRVRYPEECRCRVDIRFEVQVPQSINYDLDKIGSVSGDVTVSGVSGRVRASSVSGSVHVKDITGPVNASSVSGNVEVEITRLDAPEDMKFSSVSGNVNVTVPSNLDADISMSSLSGSLNTDFPSIEVIERKHGPGKSARGRTGSGSRTLRMSSVSGSLSLRQQ